LGSDWNLKSSVIEDLNVSGQSNIFQPTTNFNNVFVCKMEAEDRRKSTPVPRKEKLEAWCPLYRVPGHKGVHV
jgi:hypothetical protein